MKKLNIKIMAASVFLGSVAFGSAQADSLLAPLIISDNSIGFETVLDLKVRGNGTANARFSAADVTDLHYTYLRKGNSLASLFNLTSECNHENGPGRVSSWDMITHTINPVVDFLAKPAGSDASAAFTPAVDFYGMAVIDDVAAAGQEGDMSGFAYVIDFGSGMMLDYKLLNNHKSTQSGNFSSGFTRKTSVDLAWNPLARDATAWLAIATGANMTQGVSWAGSVNISQQQNTVLGNSSPKFPHSGVVADVGNTAGGGVYDNDELNISGDIPVDVTCMGIFNRNTFLSRTQEERTRFGGWTRKSIVGSNGSTGGMVYKIALKWLPTFFAGSGDAKVAFQDRKSVV